MEKGGNIFDKQFIFVIGAPRSGTTWLQTLLGENTSIATTVELTIFHKYIGPWVDAWESEQASISSQKWYLGQPMIWSEEEFNGFIKDFLQKSYSKVLEKNSGASHILDKHPGYTFQVDLIKKWFPNAKFIHLIRDGRNVANSLVQVRKKLGKGYGTKNFDTAALQWSQFVNEAKKASKFSDDYLEVRYEDLVENTTEELSKILHFCDIHVSIESVRATSEKFDYKTMKANRVSQEESIKITSAHFNQDKSELSSYQDYLFNKVAGSLLIELGYETNENWWAKNSLSKVFIPIQHKFKILKRKL